jgi:hypothetical protein
MGDTGSTTRIEAMVFYTPLKIRMAHLLKRSVSF